jgi:putative transposase
MTTDHDPQKADRWARLRFAIIGPLLATPPSSPGELRQTLQISYARWDLSAVELIDPPSLSALCSPYPLDKTANADGQRRRLDPRQTKSPATPPPASPELPPLLRKLLLDYAATGRPPAYLPKHDDAQETS